MRPHSSNKRLTPPSRSAAMEWLTEKRGHFDELVASVEDHAIFMLDPEGFILDWNMGAGRLYGYTAAEIVGENFSRFYCPEDRGFLPGSELKTALETGRFMGEGWRYRNDDNRFWAALTINAIRAPNGEVAGFLKITRDLTERKQSEESQRKSAEPLRLMIESVKDYAIFLLDSEGHVMSWNCGARRIKQYEEPEILGVHFSIFYPPEARAIGLPAGLLKNALRNGSVEDEGWRLRKDGTRFWANVVITALYDDQKELRGYAKITRDLTGQRQIEWLREAGRRKDAFLATLAHELRNPLGPILTAVDMIQHSPNNPTLVSELGGVLKTQVGQMTHLIDDLLDMARVTSGKVILQKSDVLLSEMIDTVMQAVRPAMEERGHEFICEIPPNPVVIHGDFHRLNQILTNVLFNAVKYTPPEGEIRLVARQDADSLEIRIKDNGIGIPPVLQDAIFELFDQGASNASDGLGIGLTLVKTLTELHGGSVSVFSEGDGCGSEFTLRLPVPATPLGNQPESEDKRLSPVPPNPVRILVADDSRNTADVLGMFLRIEGFEVAVAYDGQEAVDVATTFSPQLAFLDLGMPRLGGLEAARMLRSIFPNIRLVAISGWGAADDKRRTAEAGFDLHLIKPAKPADIREALDLINITPSG